MWRAWSPAPGLPSPAGRSGTFIAVGIVAGPTGIGAVGFSGVLWITATSGRSGTFMAVGMVAGPTFSAGLSAGFSVAQPTANAPHATATAASKVNFFIRTSPAC